MVFIPFRKLIFTDDTISRFQENVSDVFTSIQNSLLINSVLQNGILNQGITFVSGNDNYISHGLSRKPKGYIITSKNTPVDIYTSSTVNPDQNAIIILKSNANAVVNIVFF